MPLSWISLGGGVTFLVFGGLVAGGGGPVYGGSCDGMQTSEM